MSGTEGLIWWKGRVVAGSEVGLSPLDQGVLTGDGLFETLVAVRGRPFALTRHWQRLSAGAEALGLVVPTLESIDGGLRALLEAKAVSEARLRITVTRGPMLSGVAFDGGTEGECWMLATPLREWPVWERVVVGPWGMHSRSPVAGFKVTSYAGQLRALRWAQQRGAGECLLANEREELSEGAASNVFVVREGKLWTPPLTAGCLPGVTRALVLVCAERLGIPVMEEPLPMGWIRQGELDEMVLTSSTRGVQAVGWLEGWELPAERPVTAALRKAYQTLMDEEIDP